MIGQAGPRVAGRRAAARRGTSSLGAHPLVPRRKCTPCRRCCSLSPPHTRDSLHMAGPPRLPTGLNNNKNNNNNDNNNDNNNNKPLLSSPPVGGVGRERSGPDEHAQPRPVQHAHPSRRTRPRPRPAPPRATSPHATRVPGPGVGRRVCPPTRAGWLLTGRANAGPPRPIQSLTAHPMSAQPTPGRVSRFAAASC